MKTKLLLAVSTALVCAALAVFVSGKISDNSASSFATENVEALSEIEYIPYGSGYIFLNARNRWFGWKGCRELEGATCIVM